MRTDCFHLPMPSTPVKSGTKKAPPPMPAAFDSAETYASMTGVRLGGEAVM